MPGFTRPSTKWFSIEKKEGAGPMIREYVPNGDPIYHQSFAGDLVGIDLQQKEWQKRTYYKYAFMFAPPAEGEPREILTIGEGASAARGLLITLCSCAEPIEHVAITPWENHSDDGYSYINLSVQVNGHDVDWNPQIINNMPDSNILPNGQVDDSERRVYIRKIWKRVVEQKLAVVDMGNYLSGSVTGSNDTKHQPTSTQKSGDRVAAGQPRDGSADADALMSEPNPTNGGATSPSQKPTSSPQSESAPSVSADFDDIDDDLPF